jgi:hypothetical protein
MFTKNKGGKRVETCMINQIHCHFGEIDLNVILYGNTELLIDQNKDITFNRSKQGYYF